MLTEIVTNTKELVELSTGTIRFVIEHKPVSYTDMAGRNLHSSAEAELVLKYSALSAFEVKPFRLIVMKIGLGIANVYHEGHKEKLSEIRKVAVDEIRTVTESRKVLEGSFE